MRGENNMLNPFPLSGVFPVRQGRLLHDGRLTSTRRYGMLIIKSSGGFPIQPVDGESLRLLLNLFEKGDGRNAKTQALRETA